jgi:hypothetical protein
LVDCRGLALRIVGGDVQSLAGPRLGPLLIAAVALGYVLLAAWFLYRNKIMLRV